MSAKPPKTALQELLQRRGSTLPRYETRRVGGEDHAPLFSSRVRVDGLETIVDGVGSSKRAAEACAAEMALRLLRSVGATERVRRSAWTVEESASVRPITPPLAPDAPADAEEVAASPIMPPLADERVVLWIDGENLPRDLARTVTSWPDASLAVRCVVGPRHALAAEDHAHAADVVVAQTLHRDGADVALAMLVARALLLDAVMERVRVHVVATGDHFGAALVDLVRSNVLGLYFPSGSPWRCCVHHAATSRDVTRLLRRYLGSPIHSA
jgi:hypothetical protein